MLKLLGSLLLLSLCQQVWSEETVSNAVPLGLKPVPIPDENPMSPEKIALGKQLFFDPRLSKDHTISCASCHNPEKGFSNGEQFATGVNGQLGGRNSPTIINSAYQHFQFWDGREPNLEHQALGPIQNPIEMTMTLDEVVGRLKEIKGYQAQFQKVFGTEVTEIGIATAIAAYERTILSGNAPFDKWKAGEESALSEAAERGRVLFFGRGACSSCHAGHNFTDNGFHNIGIGMDQKEPDLGRAAISHLKGDTGSFKTPTLREIARTAPYMHDGSLRTLEQVVEHYNKGGIPNPYLDEEIFPLKLNAQEQQDLVTFMKEALSSPDYPNHKAPKLPD